MFNASYFRKYQNLNFFDNNSFAKKINNNIEYKRGFNNTTKKLCVGVQVVQKLLITGFSHPLKTY